MPIPVILASLLATLAQNGLSLLGNAVITKGKEVVEKELGVNLDSMSQTPEGLLELKKLEFAHQEFLINAAYKTAELELRELEEDNKNTASAREMNVKVQETTNASWLSKNAAYILDFLIIVTTLILSTIIFCATYEISNKELAYSVFGSLITMCVQILNYHRGTSRSSQAKDGTINDLVLQAKK